MAGIKLITLVFIIIQTILPELKAQQINLFTGFATDTIMIGEQTQYNISVEQPDNIVLIFPPFSNNLSANIEILKVNRPDTTRFGENLLRIEQSLIVTSFNRGEQKVEPMQFAFMLDNSERAITSNTTTLTVISPQLSDETTIYDIKSPFSVPIGVFEVATVILPLLLLLLLSWFLYRYFSKKRQVQALPEEKPKPKVPAHVIALAQLKELKSQQLWQKGEIKSYYIKLTEIVRRYIENRFGTCAMEMTSFEILTSLKREKDVKDESLELLQDCLEVADLVKFAKGMPTAEEHEKSLESAFHFVKSSCNLNASDTNHE